MAYELFDIPREQTIQKEVLDLFQAVQWGRRDSTTDRFKVALRASSMPICPRAYHIYRRLPPKKRPFEDESFASEAATLQGTALHAVLQKWFGIQGELYGNWVCLKCKKIRRHKYGIQTCKKCGSEMYYQEYAMTATKKFPFTGHIDALVRVGRTRFLLDFKGSSPAKIRDIRHQGRPHEKHYFQVNAYAHAVNARQKLIGNFGKIKKVIILYVDRSTPNRLMHPVQVPISRRIFEQTIDFIKEGRRSVKRMELPSGLCATPNDDYGTYCKVRQLCFSRVCEAKLHDRAWPEAKSVNSTKALERAMIEL